MRQSWRLAGRLRDRKHPGLALRRGLDLADSLHSLVRVRNTPAEQRRAWATYVRALLRATGLTSPVLAQRIGVSASTVWRWETEKQKPEDAGVVERIATLFKLDLDEVLAAAGLKPNVEPPIEPTREVDEELELILISDLPQWQKDELISYITERREQDKQRRLQDLDMLIHRRRRTA